LMSSTVAKLVFLGPIFRVRNSQKYSERVRWLGDDKCFPRRGIAAQQAMCGLMRYPVAETAVSANCRAASKELHCVTPAKLERRNDE
jgi:hypothetical protein